MGVGPPQPYRERIKDAGGGGGGSFILLKRFQVTQAMLKAKAVSRATKSYKRLSPP